MGKVPDAPRPGIGISGENSPPMGKGDAPSIGVLEGEILRVLWDADKPQSSVQVFETLHFIRRAAQQEMQSPSTIAVTLSRMVDKGLLLVDTFDKNKRRYYPAQSRAEVIASIMDDICKRFIGQPAGVVFSRTFTPEQLETSPGREEAFISIDEVAVSLKKLQAKDTKPTESVRIKR